MVIPGNFKDIKTGETLTPVYKFQDAMQVWHEKPLHKCTQLELWNYAIQVWNIGMEKEIELQLAKKEIRKAKSWLTFWIMLDVFLALSLFYFLVIT
jgi:hypothetical protein